MIRSYEGIKNKGAWKGMEHFGGIFHMVMLKFGPLLNLVNVIFHS
jgi:hypothetical protein